MTNTIQVRRGANADLPATLAQGEFGFSTDTKQLHIGDGSANHEVVLSSAVTNKVSIWLGAEDAYLPATNPATLVEAPGAGAYAGWSYLAFDDTTSEHAVWRALMQDYNEGNILVTAFFKPATTPSGTVGLNFNILTIGLANVEAFDQAAVVDTGVNVGSALNTTTHNTDVITGSSTIDPANVAKDDLMVIELSRDVASDNLVGDGQLLGILIEYIRS